MLTKLRSSYSRIHYSTYNKIDILINKYRGIQCDGESRLILTRNEIEIRWNLREGCCSIRYN